MLTLNSATRDIQTAVLMKGHELIEFDKLLPSPQPSHSLPKNPSSSGRTMGTVTVSFGAVATVTFAQEICSHAYCLTIHK
jgi:hypothetical protein